MPWSAVAWSVAWVVTGLSGAAVIRRLGYHPRTWFLVGALTGPLVPVAWTIRRSRGHRAPEVVEPGWPPRGDVDLLVLPMRGPTPDLVRAVTELRGERRRVTIARVVSFDAPHQELAQCRLQLASDRDALGLPSAELVLLSGVPARAIAAYAETTGVSLALVDAEAADLVGRIESVRVVTPRDVPQAERRRSVRVLAPSKLVARVVELPGARTGEYSTGRLPS